MNLSREKINKVVEYLKNEKYANAEKVALSVIKQDPNNSIVWAILGGIYSINILKFCLMILKDITI